MSNATASTSSTTTVTSTDSTSVSSTVVTETSTVTSGSTSFISTTESTSLSTITSSVSATPSTTTVAPSSIKTTTPSSVVEVTSYITETPTSNGSPAAPTVITLTSTAAPPSQTQATTTSQTASASSSRASALTASGADSSSSSGLSSGGKIAIAVVIPLVAIALACIFGLFFYKKRQKRKSEEAMRQKEMAEYGFNPNNDPTLAPVGAAYADNVSESAEENSGYRGWGNTSTTQRKPSTTMGSGSRGPVGGMAMSESSSNPGGYGHQGQGSDQFSGDTVTNGIGAAGAAAGAGALGGATAARRRSQTDINREPSNASSAYSTGHAHSELSDDIQGGAVPGPYYHEEVPYNIYSEQQPSQGPYSDERGPGQPVIQNVGARRDTRIERVPTFPQQQTGNAGIAQNF